MEGLSSFGMKFGVAAMLGASLSCYLQKDNNDAAEFRFQELQAKKKTIEHYGKR